MRSCPLFTLRQRTARSLPSDMDIMPEKTDIIPEKERSCKFCKYQVK